MPTGILSSETFLEHCPPDFHPERPGRLTAIVDHLRATGWWDRLAHLPFGPATLEQVCAVHDAGYVESVRRVCEAGGGVLDQGDTWAVPASWEAALLAAGGVCAAVDAVLQGRVENAFCLVRPPGHHAMRDKAMGFCLFNNVAIAARHARRAHGVERVLIVDFDVHHGNGSQQAFWEDASVFFVSLHQYPHYPGTGRRDEVGAGVGAGFTRNFPFPPGTPEAAWLDVFEQDIPAIADGFRPDLVLVSAGFDAHRDDPLAHQNLTTAGYASIGRALASIAARHCEGRLVAALEGGYHPRALAEGVEAVLCALSEGAADGLDEPAKIKEDSSRR